MSDESPTLKDIWRLLGTFNKRLDAHERQLMEIRDGLSAQISGLAAQMQAGFGALKASIEARDFRLDEHGRRLSDLESKL